jgi:hypothetical protein
MQRVNYLNNRDLLREIHTSKTTYCAFKQKSDADFDIILYDIGDINQKNIRQARKNRAARLAYQAFEQARAQDPRVKLDQFEVKTRSISKQELVFRIMTWEHIPLAPAKPSKKPAESILFEDTDATEELEIVKPKYVKVNFPPFQHYRLDDADQPQCVGKSHWQGGLKTGHFCRDHGSMTPKLARMFMMLCDRYAMRGNWRGYTYRDEMKGQALLQLSQVGLQFDESKSNNPFSYYTATVTNSFTRILNTEKRNQNIRDDILELNGLNPSYTRQGEWRSGSDDYD